MLKKPFLLFDFDGVIANSFGLAFDIQHEICPHLTQDEYRSRFAGNIHAWQSDPDAHTAECRSDIDFFTEYHNRMKNGAPIVPGMKEVLETLALQCTIIIISSTTTPLIQELLQQYGVEHTVLEVLGVDVAPSKSEKIRMVFTQYNVEANECIFITDTLGDVREAEHVGVDSIAVSWGYHTKQMLFEGKLAAYVQKPEQLPEAIFDYFRKAE